MPEQLPDAVTSERLYRLQAAISRQQAAFNARCLGRRFDVLFEKPARHPGQIVGRSPYLQPVQVVASPALIGEIRAVTITELRVNSLIGELVAASPSPAGGRSACEASRVGAVDRSHPELPAAAPPSPFRGGLSVDRGG
jgi:tRNA-2-methylthio-N6-dimethylallyladenosine synthase